MQNLSAPSSDWAALEDSILTNLQRLGGIELYLDLDLALDALDDPPDTPDQPVPEKEKPLRALAATKFPGAVRNGISFEAYVRLVGK